MVLIFKNLFLEIKLTHSEIEMDFKKINKNLLLHFYKERKVGNILR